METLTPVRAKLLRMTMDLWAHEAVMVAAALQLARSLYHSPADNSLLELVRVQHFICKRFDQQVHPLEHPAIEHETVFEELPPYMTCVVFLGYRVVRSIDCHAYLQVSRHQVPNEFGHRLSAAKLPDVQQRLR